MSHVAAAVLGAVVGLGIGCLLGELVHLVRGGAS